MPGVGQHPPRFLALLGPSIEPCNLATCRPRRARRLRSSQAGLPGRPEPRLSTVRSPWPPSPFASGPAPDVCSPPSPGPPLEARSGAGPTPAPRCCASPRRPLIAAQTIPSLRPSCTLLWSPPFADTPWPTSSVADPLPHSLPPHMLLSSPSPSQLLHGPGPRHPAIANNPSARPDAPTSLSHRAGPSPRPPPHQRLDPPAATPLLLPRATPLFYHHVDLASPSGLFLSSPTHPTLLSRSCLRCPRQGGGRGALEWPSFPRGRSKGGTKPDPRLLQSWWVRCPFQCRPRPCKVRGNTPPTD